MRILLAAPDRDFLRCFQTILADTIGETVTAFDGTQVLTLAAEERFDAVILARDIPRVDWRQIVQRFNNVGTPVIVLLNEPVSSQHLLDDTLANDYLSNPFTSKELIDTVIDVIAKKASHHVFAFADMEADVTSFRIVGGPRLTAAELDVLRQLAMGKTLDLTGLGVLIGALNVKFMKQNSPARIRYRAGEGYQLVVQNE